MVAHACNLHTWEAERGELRIRDQSGLHSKILSSKEEKKKSRLTIFFKKEQTVKFTKGMHDIKINVG
jgi:hypothetical protein